jgi:hypothetical protein
MDSATQKQRVNRAKKPEIGSADGDEFLIGRDGFSDVDAAGTGQSENAAKPPVGGLLATPDSGNAPKSDDDLVSSIIHLWGGLRRWKRRCS